MEYKNLEKTTETMKTNPSKSSSGKTLGWIIGVTLVGLSITYQQCPEYNKREYERKMQEKQHQEQRAKSDNEMKNMIHKMMEKDR